MAVSTALATERESALTSALRFVVFLSVLAVLLTPLIVVPGQHGLIIGKTWWFRLWGMAGIFAGSMLYGPLLLKPLPAVLGVFRVYIIGLLFATFFGVFAFHSLLSHVNRGFGVLDMVIAFGISVFAWRQFTPAAWRLLVRFILFVALVVSVVALLSLFGVSVYSSIATATWRISGTFGNALYLAAFALCTNFIALGVAMSHKEEAPMRALAVLVFVLGLIVIFYTGSRGALVAMMIGLVAMPMVAFCMSESSQALRRRALLIVAAVCLACLALLSVVRTFGLASEWNTILTRFDGVNVDDGRVSAYGLALRQWLHRPFLGWGPGNLYYAALETEPATVADPVKPDLAHNQALEHLATSGVLGFLLWLALWSVAGVSALTRRFGDDIYVAIGFSSALVGLFFMHMFFFETTTTFLLFALMLAWLSSPSPMVSDRSDI